MTGLIGTRWQRLDETDTWRITTVVGGRAVLERGLMARVVLERNLLRDYREVVPDTCGLAVGRRWRRAGGTFVITGRWRGDDGGLRVDVWRDDYGFNYHRINPTDFIRSGWRPERLES